MQIRKATLADCPLLMQLGITTFTQTYAAHNTKENILLYLEKAFNETQLNKELESIDEAYFVISDYDLPIAYVKLNYNCCPPDVTNENMLEIQRIYVAGEHQQKGLGKELLKISELEAANSGASYIWLGVWQQNLKAIQFYQKNGFSIMGTHDFWLGNDRQSDFIMHKKIG